MNEAVDWAAGGRIVYEEQQGDGSFQLLWDCAHCQEFSPVEMTVCRLLNCRTILLRETPYHRAWFGARTRSSASI